MRRQQTKSPVRLTSAMKTKIRELRAQDVPWPKIANLLNISRSTAMCVIVPRVRRPNTAHDNLVKKIRGFTRESRKGCAFRTENYGVHEVVAKFGEEVYCYLTGRGPFNIYDTTKYHFDHFVPRAKGGDNSLENMRIACAGANTAKGDLFVQEFVQLCVEVVTYAGYKVINPVESMVQIVIPPPRPLHELVSMTMRK